MKQQIQAYASESREELFSLLEALCKIPAPSGQEEKRAAFCKEWLEKNGAQGVYIDEALNVVFPLNCEGSNEITVFVAHTDTVFPDTEPMPYFDDGKIVRCPGVGDDTACLVVLLLMAKFFVQNKIQPKGGILFVANSGEEGLGNLKGTRQLFADYAGRVKQFVSFDSKIHTINHRCVGSHRYEVEVKTVGGHSFNNFGNPNALNELAGIVREIYAITPPNTPDTHTTYNVGELAGGTSVNTIAQSAKMLCEYRSDDLACLNYMQAQFERIFAAAKREGVEVLVRKIGDRPCQGDVDPEALEALRLACAAAITDTVDVQIRYKSGSTDCNIPLSLGIPAMCIGVYIGDGMHTREEWAEKESMVPGLEIAIKLGLSLT